MIGGFTGTRNGATAAQTSQFREQLRRWHITELHHGASPRIDCADWMADRLAREAGIPVIQHPPADFSSAAMLARNNEVVAPINVLFVCPSGWYEVLRSGTWATVRRARKRGVRIIVIWPDGEVTNE